MIDDGMKKICVRVCSTVSGSFDFGPNVRVASLQPTRGRKPSILNKYDVHVWFPALVSRLDGMEGQGDVIFTIHLYVSNLQFSRGTTSSGRRTYL
jgi:hypothetical protein